MRFFETPALIKVAITCLAIAASLPVTPLIFKQLSNRSKAHFWFKEAKLAINITPKKRM
jgi:hypothetical protein